MNKTVPIELHDAGQGVTELHRGNKKMGSIFDDGSLCTIKTGGMNKTFGNKKEAIREIQKTFGPVVRPRLKSLTPREAVKLEERITLLASGIGATELDPASPRRITPDDILEAGIKLLMGAKANPKWFDLVKRLMVNSVLRAEGNYVPSSYDRLPERNRTLRDALDAIEREDAAAAANPMKEAFSIATKAKVEAPEALPEISADHGKPEAPAAKADHREPAPPPPEDMIYAPADPIDVGLTAIFDILPSAADIQAGAEATPIADEATTPPHEAVAEKPIAAKTSKAKAPARPKPAAQYAYNRHSRMTRAEANELRRRIISKEETMKDARKRLDISQVTMARIVDGTYKASDD